ncbi:MULE domain-containing protein, partial [Aphis craccivora]
MRSTLPKSKITLEREQFLNDKMMLWKSRNIDRHQCVCQVSSNKAASPKPGENVKENVTATYIIVTGSRTEFGHSLSTPGTEFGHSCSAPGTESGHFQQPGTEFGNCQCFRCMFLLPGIFAQYQIQVRICNNNYKAAWLHPKVYDSMQTREEPQYISELEDHQQQIHYSVLSCNYSFGMYTLGFNSDIGTQQPLVVCAAIKIQRIVLLLVLLNTTDDDDLTSLFCDFGNAGVRPDLALS